MTGKRGVVFFAVAALVAACTYEVHARGESWMPKPPPPPPAAAPADDDVLGTFGSTFSL